MTNAPADAEARFRACLAQTLKWEGGYSNDKYDPGGATMHGIIQREYDAYRARKGLSKRDVRLIAQAEEQEIYRHSYWDEVRADELPKGVDLAVFDFGVNSGPPRAVKAMQRALGVAADGRIGQITLDAIDAADPDELVEGIMAQRRSFLRQIKTFWRFGKGWMRRCDGIEQQGLAWAGTSSAVAFGGFFAVEPEFVGDEQAACQGKAYDERPERTFDTSEGKAAIVTTGAGSASTLLAVTQSASTAYSAGNFDLVLFLLTLASNQAFIVGVCALTGGLVGWFSRGRLIRQEAV